MSSQIQITGETKVKSLTGVLVGTSGVVSSLNIDGSLGIPQLDVNGKILVSQLPNSVMEYKGTWNAATNTPTLVNGTGNQGDVYLCNVAGTVNFGAGAIAFFVGDQVIYSGSIWQRASGATGTVTSVAVTETGDSLNITGSPITTSGTINIGFNGTNLQYINGAGNLTTFPALTGYVPYTGATQDVDLGAFKLNAQSLHAKGTGGLGHLGLKHQSASATASANEVSLFADSLGDLGWLNGNLYLSKFITSSNTAARSYTFPNASGTIALTSNLSSYVPYTGATASLEMGTGSLGIQAGQFILFNRAGSNSLGSSSYQAFVDAAQNNGVYFQLDASNNLGIFGRVSSTTTLVGYISTSGSFNGTSFVKTGGTSSQFLKADGSVDSSTYLTTSSAASTYIPYTGTGISVYGLSAIGEYDGGAQIPAGYGGSYALTLGNGAIGNGLSLYTTGYINAGAITTAGFSRVTNATASTSTITGAFVVTGGVGIGGALYGTSATFSSSVQATAMSIGVAPTANILVVRGENVNNDGTIQFGIRGFLQHRDASTTITSLANDYNSNSAKMEFRMKGNTTSDAKMTILGSGNVGIGTPTPIGKLNVKGGRFIVTATSTDSNTYVEHNGTEGRIGVTYDTGGSYAPLVFLTSDTPRMTITSGGITQINGTNGGVRLTLQNTDNTGYMAFTEQEIRMWRPNGSGADFTIATQAISGTLGAGAIVFTPANVERMRITSGGIVTIPYQVSFKGYMTHSPDTSLTKGSWNTVPYNAEEYDVQSNFSTSTYRFTAPVAGKYLFTVNLNTYGLDDTARLNIALYINSSQTRLLYAFANLPTGNTGDTNFGGSDILNLSAGNTVEVRVFTDGSGTFNMSSQLTYNSFSGHLLG